jgi:hypothetical protein
MIPQHCIDTFKDLNTEYPSITELKLGEGILRKLIKRSETLWFYSVGKDVIKELLSYQEMGMVIYYEKNMQDLDYKVFILSTVKRKDLVEFTINNIKKQIEKDGNN